MRRDIWTAEMEQFFFNGVVKGIESGRTIKDSIHMFCQSYPFTVESAKNKWRSLSKRNELAVNIAKWNWQNKVKPELEERKREQALINKRVAEARKDREAYRRQSAARGVRPNVLMEKTQSDKGRLVRVDVNGVVQVLSNSRYN